MLSHLAIIGGDWAPSLEGTEKFLGPKFFNDLVLGKNVHFDADNF